MHTFPGSCKQSAGTLQWAYHLIVLKNPGSCNQAWSYPSIYRTFGEHLVLKISPFGCQVSRYSQFLSVPLQYKPLHMKLLSIYKIFISQIELFVKFFNIPEQNYRYTILLFFNSLYKTNFTEWVFSWFSFVKQPHS